MADDKREEGDENTDRNDGAPSVGGGGGRDCDGVADVVGTRGAETVEDSDFGDLESRSARSGRSHILLDNTGGRKKGRAKKERQGVRHYC